MNKRMHYIISAACGLALILATLSLGHLATGGSIDRFSQFEVAMLAVGVYLLSKLLLVEQKSDGAQKEKKTEG